MPSNNLSNSQDFCNFLSTDEDFIANAEELNPSLTDLEVNLNFDAILGDLVNSTATFEQTNITEKANNKQNKRQRTIFTSQQLVYMEKEYLRKNYLERTERIQIAQRLGLPEETVKVWFQNRRTKDKRLNSKGQTFASHPNVNCAPHEYRNQQAVSNMYHQTYQNWNGYEQQYQGPNPSLVANRVNYTNENYPYQYGNHHQYNGNYNYHNY